jgi:secreted PhoX family phosphatase
MKKMFHGRRRLLKAGLAAFVTAMPVWGCAARGTSAPLLGFNAVPVSAADSVTVPPGYRVQVLSRWGDPLGLDIGAPEFRMDGGNSAADQALQAGMHHDAIELFPLPSGNALLAVNYEYTDDGLLHPDGMKTWSAEKVLKSQAAHGVGVLEVAFQNSEWKVVKASKYARRITAYTPMRMSGPARDSQLVAGEVLGTINNCGGGRTPWGTYLTCEENFNGYFANAGAIPPEQRRYGISARGAGYRWHEFDRRFDAQATPAEPNKFGWVVEIDPYEPAAQPVKRTALGRFKHEGAMVVLAGDGRVVVYMGDDERFEYIYKFVSKGTFNPANRAANRDVLDEGTLYAAKFSAHGQGEWIALPQTAEALVFTRIAADQAGATKMDRPEWLAMHPVTQDVYVTLTNNDRRGGDGQPGTDAANPRASNVYGHIIRWRELGGDPAASKFRWELFALGGEEKGFGSPDGLWFDPRGVLWIQTDVSTSILNRGPYAKLGNNQMLAADVASGEIRRFLTGPAGCEVTGVTLAPDGRTMFVNIQHPGEPASERSNPDAPRAVSNWPDQRSDGRPRSATVAIRREDGGIIGT